LQSSLSQQQAFCSGEVAAAALHLVLEAALCKGIIERFPNSWELLSSGFSAALNQTFLLEGEAGLAHLASCCPLWRSTFCGSASSQASAALPVMCWKSPTQRSSSYHSFAPWQSVSHLTLIYLLSVFMSLMYMIIFLFVTRK